MDRPVAAWRQHYEFFAEYRNGFEDIGQRVRIEWRRDQGGVDLEFAHALDQAPGCAGFQFQRDVGPTLVILREQARQAACGDAFHRAEPQPSARTVFAYRMTRLVG